MRTESCLLLAAAALALVTPARAAEPTIFVVRHAEKGAASADAPKDPELSPEGRARAESLARTLRDAGVTTIYVTEFRRTRQTAEPLARAAGIEPVVVPGAETAALVGKLKEGRGSVLVVGHSNTVPDILKALGHPQPITIGDDEYDNLFVFIPGSEPQLLRLRYR